MKIFKSKSNKGFTLIEAVLYLAIAGTVLYFISGFAFNSIFGKSKIESVQDVNENSRTVLDEISSTIGDSAEVNGALSEEGDGEVVAVNIDLDFEDVSAGLCPTGWACSGDAVVASASDGQGCVIAGSINGSNYAKAGCDAGTGSLVSDTFNLPSGIDHVDLLRAGGAETGGFYVKRVSDDSVLCSNEDGSDSDSFFPVTCSGLDSYAGVPVYLYILDNQNSGWGKTYVDYIRFKDASDNVLEI
jgi:type II secretory pathway pseudopilin PulG